MQHTHVNCCEGFRSCCAGEMVSEIPEIVYAFGRKLNALSLWLLEICLSASVVSCYSLSEDSAEFWYVPLCNTGKKTSWICWDIASFQGFKVFLLLPHACEDFTRVLLFDRKKS